MKPIEKHLPKTQESMVPFPVEERVVECGVCGDIGYVMLNVPLDHALHGKLVDCPKICTTVQRRRQEQAERLVSHLERHFKSRCNYHDVMMPDYAAMIDKHRDFKKQDAYVAGLEFIERLSIVIDGKAKASVIYHGQFGTGKTFLASCIHNELWARGVVSWCMTLRQTVNRIKDTYGYKRGTGAITEDDVLKALKDVPVLIWDEMDMHKQSVRLFVS